MKIRAEVTINRSRQRVVELITNPANTAKWQTGVKSVELVSGEKDAEGARSRVVFEFNGLHLEATETTIKHSPPDLFASTFEARGVRNTVENRFYEVGSGQTRWVMNNVFDFGGLLSLAEVFARRMIAKQIVQSMNRFKAFAEQQ